LNILECLNRDLAFHIRCAWQSAAGSLSRRARATRCAASTPVRWPRLRPALRCRLGCNALRRRRCVAWDRCDRDKSKNGNGHKGGEVAVRRSHWRDVSFCADSRSALACRAPRQTLREVPKAHASYRRHIHSSKCSGFSPDSHPCGYNRRFKTHSEAR
jgi:hypothetical protein